MAGNPQALIDWFNAGADGAIDWGNPGDFEDCVRIAMDKGDMSEDQAQGFCQLRHEDATGEPAGRGAHGGKGEVRESDRTDTLRQIKQLYTDVEADLDKILGNVSIADGFKAHEALHTMERLVRSGEYGTAMKLAKETQINLRSLVRYDEPSATSFRKHAHDAATLARRFDVWNSDVFVPPAPPQVKSIELDEETVELRKEIAAHRGVEDAGAVTE